MDISITFLHNITGFITTFRSTNIIALSQLFFVFVILAYKTFQIVLRAIIIGTISASFPVIANLLGFGIPLTISSILWFALFGAVSYITYSMITGGLKIVKWSLMPFKRIFKSTPKEHHYHKTIIIREEKLKRKKRNKTK